MKIAVAFHNKKNVTGHTGRCRRFLIYDIDQNEITDKHMLEIDKYQTFHENHDPSNQPLGKVDVLITGGMGMGLVRRLQAMGIEPIITTETDPERSVLLYLAGELPIEQPDPHHSCQH